MTRKFTRLLPPHSRRRRIASEAKNIIFPNRFFPNKAYKKWIKNIEPLTLEPVMHRQDVQISVVVPMFNTPSKYMRPLIKSMLAQTYKNWQLCIADGSDNLDISREIKAACISDERIVYTKVGKNLGISGNTNLALEKTTGDYVAFLDHDDVLPEWSLNEVAVVIRCNPKASIIYSDEDRLTENGKNRLTPFFKPDWSPELFLCANYITHLFVIKKSLATKIKGLRSLYDGSQDYDYALRAVEQNIEVVHIPKILYHMRKADGSTAKSIGEKTYAHDAGKIALEDYLLRNNIDARVESIPEKPTNFKIAYTLPARIKISIIIPFKDKVELLKACIKSIEKTTYNNYELILLSNNSKEKQTHEYLEKLQSKPNMKIYYYNKPFNYSAINNFGRKKAQGSILIFLNNDTEIITETWLEELASVANRKEIGAVGPMLLYPDKTIQHAGIIMGMTGMAGHVFRNLEPNTFTPFWFPDLPRNYLAVTGACLAVSVDKFDAIGGFNEDMIIAGSDVVLCLSLIEKGYRNVYWPFVRLTHHESKSVGSYKNAPPTDYDISIKKYKPYLNYKDPYYNKNLNIESEIPIYRIEYEK